MSKSGDCLSSKAQQHGMCLPFQNSVLLQLHLQDRFLKVWCQCWILAAVATRTATAEVLNSRAYLNPKAGKADLEYAQRIKSFGSSDLNFNESSNSFGTPELLVSCLNKSSCPLRKMKCLSFICLYLEETQRWALGRIKHRFSNRCQQPEGLELKIIKVWVTKSLVNSKLMGNIGQTSQGLAFPHQAPFGYVGTNTNCVWERVWLCNGLWG